jgi:hypothetical protein
MKIVRATKKKKGEKGHLHSKNDMRIYDWENMYKRYTKGKVNEDNMETKRS